MLLAFIVGADEGVAVSGGGGSQESCQGLAEAFRFFLRRRFRNGKDGFAGELATAVFGGASRQAVQAGLTAQQLVDVTAPQVEGEGFVFGAEWSVFVVLAFGPGRVHLGGESAGVA